MSDRFTGLIKLTQQPARRILATAGVKVETKLESPASASVEVVLQELADKKAQADMMLLLSCALPPRERVWWACLAARDVIDPLAKPPLTLTTSEAWVFKPNEENRIAAQKSIEVAEPMDNTVHVPTAIVFFDGTLGPGALAEHPCPPGAAELSAFAMNIIAFCRDPYQMDIMADVLVDRALDIARGGSGNIPAPPMTPEKVDQEGTVDEGRPAVQDNAKRDDVDKRKEPAT